MKKFRLESTVKTAESRTHVGEFLTIDPRATGNKAAILGTWTGGPGSISDERSVRHIVKSTGGKKNPQDVSIAVVGGEPAGAIATAIISEAEGSGEAPYILMPQDKLVFGVQSLPPKQSNVAPTNSSIRLPAGNVRIRLFGSYIRNSQPRQFQLNQLLNSDIVHESIGQESIHDQFDVEPRGAFIGSYVDEAMSGSTTFPYNGFNASIHVNGDGAPDITDLARGVGGRGSSGNLGTSGSFRRTIPIVSEEKTEYDSFVFDLQQMFAIDERTVGGGTKFPTSYINDRVAGTNNPFTNRVALDILTLGFDPNQVGSANFDAGFRPNIDIGMAFPFARYFESDRVRTSQVGGSNKLFSVVLTGSVPFVEGLLERSGSKDPTQDAITEFEVVPSTVQVSPGALNRGVPFTTDEISKLIFGRSNGSNGAFPLRLRIQNAYTVDLDALRGFKYGFSNVLPKKPKNVFRRDSYGQLRDMLEMAPNTAYLDDATNTISFPVEARFFADDGSIAPPEATSCSNLSTNVTSSAPFMDRDIENFEDQAVIRNRGPLNNRVVDITIEI